MIFGQELILHCESATHGSTEFGVNWLAPNFHVSSGRSNIYSCCKMKIPFLVRQPQLQECISMLQGPWFQIQFSSRLLVYQFCQRHQSLSITTISSAYIIIIVKALSKLHWSQLHEFYLYSEVSLVKSSNRLHFSRSILSTSILVPAISSKYKMSITTHSFLFDKLSMTDMASPKFILILL